MKKIVEIVILAIIVGLFIHILSLIAKHSDRIASVLENAEVIVVEQSDVIIN